MYGKSQPVRLPSTSRFSLLSGLFGLSLLLTLVLDVMFMRWWGVVGIALAGFGTRLVSSLYLSCKFSSGGAAFTSAARNDRVS